jgi:hypothetical protein
VSELRIEVDGGRRWFLPGETLSGRAVWRLEDDTEAVELRLFWYTSGKGTEDVAIIDSVRTDAAGTAGERGFSFRLPDGPYSFSGSLITLTWALELLTLPHGATERIEFVMAPTPVEVRLESLGRAPLGHGLNFNPSRDKQ